MLNRTWIFFIVFFIFFISGCFNNHEKTEQKQLFDLNWKFSEEDNNSAVKIDYNDTQWRHLDLPHDWSTDLKLNQIGLFNSSTHKIGWYRKNFNLPPEWKNKSVVINFEGIKSEIKVYLNENLLSGNTGPSDSFQFDLTSHLNYGDSNIIAVRINSLHDNTTDRLPDGSGIPKHVWLLVSDSPRID